MMNRHAFLDAWLKWLIQRSTVPLALELKLPVERSGRVLFALSP